MRILLVGTDAAVTFCLRNGYSREQVRKQIYYWQSDGKIKNYGKTGRNQAKWNLFELEEIMRQEEV